jgi:hypothetical protein
LVAVDSGGTVHDQAIVAVRSDRIEKRDTRASCGILRASSTDLEDESVPFARDRDMDSVRPPIAHSEQIRAPVTLGERLP